MSNETQNPGFKPKKSVALSGVTAGNTALCTVCLLYTSPSPRD